VTTPSFPAKNVRPPRWGRRLVGIVLGLALAGVVLAATAIASASADWRDKVDPSVLSAAQLGSTEFFV
jgi:hypothetical protein